MINSNCLKQSVVLIYYWFHLLCYLFNAFISEFLLRVKLAEEISELSQQHTIVSHKHSLLLKKLQSYREGNNSFNYYTF